MGKTLFRNKSNKDHPKSLTKYSLDELAKVLITVGAVDKVEPFAKV